MTIGLWSKFTIPRSELVLDFVLACGQSFRWTKTPDEWIGVMQNRVWKLKQHDEFIEYQVHPAGLCENGTDETLVDPEDPLPPATKSSSLSKTSIGDETDASAELLRDYFALNHALPLLYQTWTEADKRFAVVAPKYSGIRILQQEFIENVFSFICSSNNNIQRIQQMVEKLCVNYGRVICEVDGRVFHAFPAAEKLAEGGVEERLREIGFGYRAAYIAKAAKFIVENPSWIAEVKSADYATAKSLLMQLPGVGAKVADCICLMSLGHHHAVPVDTHVFAVTAQHYLPHLKQVKSVTARVYNEIGEFYRTRFGPFAGWAHSVLFTADLRQFKLSEEDKKGKSTTSKRKRRQVECD